MSVGHNPPPVLEIGGLTKRFGGVHALSGVDLSIASGEIHGLLGHNGSGKSTLIKCLSGFHEPDAGAVLKINGAVVEMPMSAGDFRKHGLAFVYQDLSLIGSLTVMDNVRIGLLKSSRGRIDWRKEVEITQALLDEFGLEAEPRTDVNELAPWERPILAIIRAIHEMREAIRLDPQRRGLLVLDEPTATLAESGKRHLFRLTRQVAEAGHSVLLVSHDIDEVLENTDRVTVLRDGRKSGSASTGELTRPKLVEMILGVAPSDVQTEQHLPLTLLNEVAVSVEELSNDKSLESVSFNLAHGEILGVTGLVGSGYDDICPVLYGALEGTGRLSVGSDEYSLCESSPSRSIANGIVLVPSDRLGEGCIEDLTVTENVTAPVLKQFSRHGRVLITKMTTDVEVLLRQFGVLPPRPNFLFRSFSGGNQQKILLAKWLQMEPRLLLLQEPTQGVDVGARAHIENLITQYTEKGGSVILASADHEQLAGICDRVLILHRGKVVGELTGESATKDNISEECFKDFSEPASLAPLFETVVSNKRASAEMGTQL